MKPSKKEPKLKKNNNTETKEETTAPQLSRRNFLSKALIGLGAVAAIESGSILASFLWPRKQPNPSETNTKMIEAGQVDDFTPLSVTPFMNGNFYLLRKEDGSFLALSARCPHLGCVVNWIPDENRFVCPCHSSAFDISGKVNSGPAPRGLDSLPVTIENNVVKVYAFGDQKPF